MSGTGKIYDFIPLGTTCIREVSFIEPTYFSIQRELDKLEEQKQKVIALIKDGRFVEALRVLENGN
jgi:hypothetical protein